MESEGSVIQPLNAHSAKNSDKEAVPDKAAQIEAALAKLHDPPRAESLIGTVISAGQPQRQPPVEIQTGIPVGGHAQLPKQSAGQDLSSVQHTKAPKGPLNAADLRKLGKLLPSAKTSKTTQPSSASFVIAPTAPEPDAPIPAAAAEVAREAEAARLAEEARHVKAAPAQFDELHLDMHRMYVYGGLWLAAIPVAMIVYVLSGVIPGGRSPGIVDFICLALEYVLGIYGLVGWVPLVLLYRKRRRG